MSFPFVQPYFGLGNSLQTAQGAAGGGAVGGWVELARTTLGSAGDTIDVTSLPDKRYYMVLKDFNSTGGTIDQYTRMGNSSIDTGSNYARRMESNGGSDSTSTNATYINDFYNRTTASKFYVCYISNLSSKEKLYQGHVAETNTAGAGNAPDRQQVAGKWANTSNPMDRIRSYNNSGTGDYAIGSEIVVLGWDPADSHTTNFWEELADVTLGSSATTLSSGTFTAKKYLWFQTYVKSGNMDYRITFNGDSGSNYATRWCHDGGSDSTSTSAAFNYLSPAGASTPRFTNTFMINNASNEKLGISHVAIQNTAGASNAPKRDEVVHKWANTSAQITSLTVAASINTLSAGTRIKVWGSD